MVTPNAAVCSNPVHAVLSGVEVEDVGGDETGRDYAADVDHLTVLVHALLLNEPLVPAFLGQL